MRIWFPSLTVSLGTVLVVALPATHRGGSCTVAVPSGPTYLLEKVQVVAPAAGTVTPGQDLLVVDGRIAAVGPHGRVGAPPSVSRIDGCGRYVVPGLADMHVHINRSDLGAYVRYGVTSVRNMWGYPELRAMLEEQRQADWTGPTIYTTSPAIDGSPPHWPHTVLADTPAEGADAVARLTALGYTTLKVYADLDIPTYDTIVAEARRRHVDFVGHVPLRVGLRHVLAAGQRSLEHLGGYGPLLGGGNAVGSWVDVDRGKMAALAEETVEAGAWVCPTLVILEMMAGASEREMDSRRAMVLALERAGAGLLIGTDAGIGRTAPGASIHDEMNEFVTAGIPRPRVLAIATEDAARFLGEENEVGRVAPGLRADLLLVRDNPLEDLVTLRTPELVMVRGRAIHPD